MTEMRPFKSLDLTKECAIIRTIFHHDVSSSTKSAYQAYLDYYADEIRRIKFAVASTSMQWNSFVVANHDELLKVVETVQNEKNSTRPQLRQTLIGYSLDGKGEFPAALNRTIDLAIRILVMINVRETSFRLQTPQTPSIQWDDDSTLVNFVTRLFRRSTLHITAKDGRIDPLFTVASMVNICGLKIEWTQSLQDHLRLDRRAHVLRVFPYKHCLLKFMEGGRAAEKTSILPETLLKETMKTLTLLFPHWDKATEKFLKQNKQTFHELTPFDDILQSSNMNDFHYWRDRLLELYEEVFRSPPTSWVQLWMDRPNPQQWLTLWIAFVVFILTTISTIASIIQAVASVKALN